jgi:hypothetical protein
MQCAHSVWRTARQSDKFGPGRFGDGLEFTHSKVLSVNLEVYIMYRHQKKAWMLRTVDVPLPLSVENLATHEREPPFLISSAWEG